MPTIEENRLAFEADVKHKNTSVYPVLKIADDYFSINNVEFDGNTCKPLLLKVPSVKESVDIESRKFKTGVMSFELNNYEYLRTILSDYVNQYQNQLLYLYYVSQTGYIEAYSGEVRRIKHTEKSVTIEAEDLTEQRTHQSLPKSYYMAYGTNVHAPTIITATSVDADDEEVFYSNRIKVDRFPIKQFVSNSYTLGGRTINLSPLTLYKDDSYMNVNVAPSASATEDNFTTDVTTASLQFNTSGNSDFALTNEIVTEYDRKPSGVTILEDAPAFISPSTANSIMNSLLYGTNNINFGGSVIDETNSAALIHISLEELPEYRCETYAMFKLTNNGQSAISAYVGATNQVIDIDNIPHFPSLSINTWDENVDGHPIVDWVETGTYNTFTVGVPYHTDAGGAGNQEFDVDVTLKWFRLFHKIFIKNVIKNSLFLYIKGRVNTGMYNANLADDELIRNPIDVMYDIVYRELGHTTFNQDDYDEAISEHTAGWVEFSTIVTEEQNSKKLLEDIAKSTKCYPRFNNKGEFVFNTIKSWYYPQDRTDARIIQDKDIVKFAYKKSSPENVYDGIEIKYNYDYAKKEYLAKKNYGLSGKTYELESNYYNLEVGVDKLGQYLLYQYRQQKLIISMTLPLKYIDVDVGDIVRMDKLISNLKAYGKDYTSIYASEGQYIYPIFKVIAVNKNLDSVNIEIIQLHSEGTNSTHLNEWIGILDEEAPVITLNGEAVINLIQGQGLYEEFGATAVDDLDGNITDSILITGEVPIDDSGLHPSGQHFITYSVSDNAGNSTSVIRTINVAPFDVGIDDVDLSNAPITLPYPVIANNYDGDVVIQPDDFDAVYFMNQGTNLHFAGLPEPKTPQELFMNIDRWEVPDFDHYDGTADTPFELYGPNPVHSNEWDVFIANFYLQDEGEGISGGVSGMQDFVRIERRRPDYSQEPNNLGEYPHQVLETYILKNQGTTASNHFGDYTEEEIIPWADWEIVNQTGVDNGLIGNFAETGDYFNINYFGFFTWYYGDISDGWPGPVYQGSSKPIQFLPEFAYLEYPVLLGDVNRDGFLNILDIVMLVNFIVGSETLVDETSVPYAPAIDVNSDGLVNILDIVSLVNTILLGVEE